MRINLQRFTLSTLTFSLATTLAVTGFSESANAQLRSGGANYNKSNVLPALVFDAFFETDDGNDILDTNSSDDIGVFLNAIEVDQIQIDTTNDNGLGLNPFQQEQGAKIFDNFEEVDTIDFSGFNDDEKFNLSASANRENGSIQYQIYQGDINNPQTGIRFAPIDVSSIDSSLDFVNNINNIIGSSNNGEYGVGKNNGDFNQDGAGVLGLAINKSIRFINEETRNGNFAGADILSIKLTPSQPSTSIPEPTTTLASIFALGFAGKFLRKSKKNNV